MQAFLDAHPGYTPDGWPSRALPPVSQPRSFATPPPPDGSLDALLGRVRHQVARDVALHEAAVRAGRLPPVGVLAIRIQYAFLPASGRQHIALPPQVPPPPRLRAGLVSPGGGAVRACSAVFRIGCKLAVQLATAYIVGCAAMDVRAALSAVRNKRRRPLRGADTGVARHK